MKFLLIRKPRVGGQPPAAQTIRAQKEYVLGLIKKGVVDCAYAFVGGCSIVNAESHEKLNEMLFAAPSCTKGAPGRTASSVCTTAGSTSYSTETSSAASRASASVAAMTTAMRSPT